LGAGSPTDLLRFGFDFEREPSVPSCFAVVSLKTSLGVVMRTSPSCADSSVLFLRRPRLGWAGTRETSGEAWGALPCSADVAVLCASAFLRDLVFLTGGSGTSGTLSP
jgi:hypothetical protein